MKRRVAIMQSGNAAGKTKILLTLEEFFLGLL